MNLFWIFFLAWIHSFWHLDFFFSNTSSGRKAIVSRSRQLYILIIESISWDQTNVHIASHHWTLFASMNQFLFHVEASLVLCWECTYKSSREWQEWGKEERREVGRNRCPDHFLDQNKSDLVVEATVYFHILHYLIYLFIHAYTVNDYHVPITVQNAGNISVNKIF